MKKSINLVCSSIATFLLAFSAPTILKAQIVVESDLLGVFEGPVASLIGTPNDDALESRASSQSRILVTSAYGFSDVFAADQIARVRSVAHAMHPPGAQVSVVVFAYKDAGGVHFEADLRQSVGDACVAAVVEARFAELAEDLSGLTDDAYAAVDRLEAFLAVEADATDCCASGGGCDVSVSAHALARLGYARLGEDVQLSAPASAYHNFPEVAVAVSTGASRALAADASTVGLSSDNLLDHLDDTVGEIEQGQSGLCVVVVDTLDLLGGLGIGSASIEVLERLQAGTTFSSSSAPFVEHVLLVRTPVGTWEAYARGQYDASSTLSGAGGAERGEAAVPILLAWVAKWVMKKAFLASVGAGIHCVFTVAFEYILGECPDLATAFENSELVNADLFIAMLDAAFAERALTSAALAVAGEVVKYLVSGSTPNVNRGPPPSAAAKAAVASTFWSGLRQVIAVSVLEEVAGALLGPMLRVGKKAWQKYKAGKDPKVFAEFFKDAAELTKVWFGNWRKTKSWEALYSDDVLRKSRDNLDKVDDYATNFGKSFDDIGEEFRNVPTPQRSRWIDHLEYRTKQDGNVHKAGGQSSKYNTYPDNSTVPSKYSSDNRFDDLAADPAVNNTTSKTRQEAMAGLEAESQGVLSSPIRREPSGNMDFFDGAGSPWDVKSPRGGNFFNVNQVGASIRRELRDKGPFPNGSTGVLEPRNVLLDCTYISDSELVSLRSWLQSNIDISELAKIKEINSNLL